MKHIKVILAEMQTSGKYNPEVKITKVNKKVSLLQAESLLFSVLSNLSEDFKSGVKMCHIYGSLIAMIQGENDGLVPLRDSAIILNTLIEFISYDDALASELTKMYLEAYESEDMDETVDFYLHYKNKYLKEIKKL